MKAIGLIGGLSWQSTSTYYRLLNEAVAARLGRHHSADLRIWSGDFEPVYRAQEGGEHGWIEALLCDAAADLVSGGADLLAIASNTSHRYSDAIEARTGVPLVHIVDATASSLKQAGMQTVLLLGTGYTMAGPHFRDRMATHGIECTTPDQDDQGELHRIIFDELVHGMVLETSRDWLLGVIARGAGRGAQGVVLGCTELGMILDEGDGAVPGFDTTRIHTRAVVEAALG